MKKSKPYRPLLAVFSFLVCVGCGPNLGQKVLSTQARVIMDTKEVRFDLYGTEHKKCLEGSKDFEGYKSCMHTARSVARAADSYAEALEAAQAAYNLKGKDGFMDMIPCLISAAENLTESLKAANLPIPDEVSKITDFVGEFGRNCK